MRTKSIVILLLLFCGNSCDYTRPFVIDGNMEYNVSNECGTITIRGSSLIGVSIACTFNGMYHINIDSLKVEPFSADDEIKNMTFKLNGVAFSGKEIETKGGETLSFWFEHKPIVPYQPVTKKLLLLPSNFITCEGKPIITDTILIQLKTLRGQ